MRKSGSSPINICVGYSYYNNNSCFTPHPPSPTTSRSLLDALGDSPTDLPLRPREADAVWPRVLSLPCPIPTVQQLRMPGTGGNDLRWKKQQQQPSNVDYVGKARNEAWLQFSCSSKLKTIDHINSDAYETTSGVWSAKASSIMLFPKFQQYVVVNPKTSNKHWNTQKSTKTPHK